MAKSNFNKYPCIELNPGHVVHSGWKRIAEEIKKAVSSLNRSKTVIIIECYHGVFENDLFEEISKHFHIDFALYSKSVFKSPGEIYELINPHLTDDPVFGILADVNIDDYISTEKLNDAIKETDKIKQGVVLIYGAGAVKIAEPDILIYADMARWEIQQRFRRNEISNLGVNNKGLNTSLQYKQAFFIDWRVCDKLKQTLFDQWDYFLDTNNCITPRMIAGETACEAMNKAVNQPFELVPYFDPGPWGGQWMREKCDLDKNAPNFAWCFNCVPEENSLLFKIGNSVIEMPAINLVFYRPVELLGEKVYKKYGAEFPIRFDFLDTIEGGNLSLQVHPTQEYIKEKFNWPYTQDESYYIMDAAEDAKVYLGLKEGISPEELKKDLYNADKDYSVFPDEKYIETWQVKKHDHVLIPGGTVHCSGKGCMVLEISATPYIFTFKLWDWGRLGLDGNPRPIHIDHGMNVIQFNRTTEWTKNNLINRTELIGQGDGWREEKTGLHELEPIETRRYWFEKEFEINSGGSVNVLNLVEGDMIIVESPQNLFPPLAVHYAETFIVPAAVDRYVIKPSAGSANKTFALIKAYIR